MHGNSSYSSIHCAQHHHFSRLALTAKTVVQQGAELQNAKEILGSLYY